MKKIIIIVVCVVIGLGLLSSVLVFDPFKLNLNIFGRELSIEKTANVITEIKKISEFTTACFFEDKVIDQRKYQTFEKKINHQEQRNQNLETIKKSAKDSWRKLKSATSSAIENAKQLSDSTVKGKAAAVGAAAKEIGIASGNSAKEVVTTSAPALKDIATADEVVIDSTEVGRIIMTVATKVRAGYDLSKIDKEDIRIVEDTISVKLPPVEIFDIIVNPADWQFFHREGNWEDSEVRAVQSGAKELIKQDAIAFGLMDKAATFGKESLQSLLKTFGFSKVVLYE